MLTIRTILYPTDLSTCAGAALPYAIQLARQHDAVIHMLYVTPVFEDDPALDLAQVSDDAPSFYTRLRDAAHERMQAIVQSYGGDDVQIEQVYARGIAPASVLLSYTEEEDIDLIVMGTHGRRGVRRMLVGSVTAEVVRMARCPVLTIRASEAPGHSPRRLQRILVPIDFSTGSEEALLYAKELAAAYGASLDLVHVLDPSFHQELQLLSMAGQGRTINVLKEEAVIQLEQLVERVGGLAEVSYHVRAGHAPTMIVEYATENAVDLIVLASHGRTGLARFLMGSVAEHVLRVASCPVLVTKPFGKSLLAHVAEDVSDAFPNMKPS